MPDNRCCRLSVPNVIRNRQIVTELKQATDKLSQSPADNTENNLLYNGVCRIPLNQAEGSTLDVGHRGEMKTEKKVR